MKCPYCGFDVSRVIDSRPTEENNSIRRRRECAECNSRFTTYERIEEINLIVVKRDENREAFNRDKIINGIIRACEKRPVTSKDIEELALRVETQLSNLLKKEITSEEIGEMVMEELKALDEVAYVRFASVYKSFSDIDTFLDELGKMLVERKK
ncbi:MAG TPA: transcriptional regulator NrdR [Clostridia bacterium]|nr:transcriptional regulator NrdR [Clostridia bacterium]